MKVKEHFLQMTNFLCILMLTPPPPQEHNKTKSWYITLSFTSLPCTSRKYQVHSTCGSMSFMPTNFGFGQALGIKFCLVDVAKSPPCPLNSMPPVWMYMPWWTAKAASTHNVSCPKSSASSIRGRSIIAGRYWSIHLNFFLWSILGSFMWVLRKATLVL